MVPTILLIETHPNNTLSPNIALPDSPLLKNTPTIQVKTTTSNNAAAVAWAKLSHQKITMDPTIAALTRQYYNACERTVNLADSFWKRVLPFLPPRLCQKMQQYNLKDGATPKLIPTESPVCPPPHCSPRQQHKHPFPNRKSRAVTTTQPYIPTLGSTPEVPSTPDQQDNLK